MRRALLALTLCLAPAMARAQPTPDTTADERAVCDVATDLVVAHRYAEARARLDRALDARAIDRTSTHPWAVLRRLVDALDPPRTLPPPPPPAPTDRRARTGLEAVSLYATAAGWGLATGAWLDVQLDIRTLQAMPWIPLVGAGAGVAVAYLVDNPESVPRGLPTALGAGLALGLLGGAALGAQGWRAGQWGVPTMTTAAWLGATGGLAGGLGIALLTRPEPGTGAFVLSGGFWGSVLGAMTAYAVADDAHLGSFALAGEAIGVAAAAATAGMLQPTHDQVHWMDLGVLTGGLVGLGVGLLLLREERAPFAASIELGMVGGGVAGYLVGTARRGRAGSGGVVWHPSVQPVAGGAVLSLTAM